MHESPSSALRKKDSSMKVGFEMMKRGEVEAVVSAGNSGAMMATGMFVMGTLSAGRAPGHSDRRAEHGSGHGDCRRGRQC